MSIHPEPSCCNYILSIMFGFISLFGCHIAILRRILFFPPTPPSYTILTGYTDDTFDSWPPMRGQDEQDAHKSLADKNFNPKNHHLKRKLILSYGPDERTLTSPFATPNVFIGDVPVPYTQQSDIIKDVDIYLSRLPSITTNTTTISTSIAPPISTILETTTTTTPTTPELDNNEIDPELQIDKDKLLSTLPLPISSCRCNSLYLSHSINKDNIINNDDKDKIDLTVDPQQFKSIHSMWRYQDPMKPLLQPCNLPSCDVCTHRSPTTIQNTNINDDDIDNTTTDQTRQPQQQQQDKEDPKTKIYPHNHPNSIPRVTPPTTLPLIFIPYPTITTILPEIVELPFEIQQEFILNPSRFDDTQFQIPYSSTTIFFSHGNATDIGQIYEWCYNLSQKLQVNFVIYDYIGYGGSQGSKRTPKQLLEGGESALLYVLDNFRDRTKNTILYGQSIGSTVTCHLGYKFCNIKLGKVDKVGYGINAVVCQADDDNNNKNNNDNKNTSNTEVKANPPNSISIEMAQFTSGDTNTSDLTNKNEQLDQKNQKHPQKQVKHHFTSVTPIPYLTKYDTAQKPFTPAQRTQWLRQFRIDGSDSDDDDDDNNEKGKSNNKQKLSFLPPYQPYLFTQSNHHLGSYLLNFKLQSSMKKQQNIIQKLTPLTTMHDNGTITTTTTTTTVHTLETLAQTFTNTHPHPHTSPHYHVQTNTNNNNNNNNNGINNDNNASHFSQTLTTHSLYPFHMDFSPTYDNKPDNYGLEHIHTNVNKNNNNTCHNYYNNENNIQNKTHSVTNLIVNNKILNNDDTTPITNPFIALNADIRASSYLLDNHNSTRHYLNTTNALIPHYVYSTNTTCNEIFDDFTDFSDYYVIVNDYINKNNTNINHKTIINTTDETKNVVKKKEKKGKSLMTSSKLDQSLSDTTQKVQYDLTTEMKQHFDLLSLNYSYIITKQLEQHQPSSIQSSAIPRQKQKQKSSLIKKSTIQKSGLNNNNNNNNNNTSKPQNAPSPPAQQQSRIRSKSMSSHDIEMILSDAQHQLDTLYIIHTKKHQQNNSKTPLYQQQQPQISFDTAMYFNQIRPQPLTPQQTLIINNDDNNNNNNNNDTNIDKTSPSITPATTTAQLTFTHYQPNPTRHSRAPSQPSLYLRPSSSSRCTSPQRSALQSPTSVSRHIHAFSQGDIAPSEDSYYDLIGDGELDRNLSAGVISEHLLGNDNQNTVFFNEQINIHNNNTGNNNKLNNNDIQTNDDIFSASTYTEMVVDQKINNNDNKNDLSHKLKHPIRIDPHDQSPDTTILSTNSIPLVHMNDTFQSRHAKSNDPSMVHKHTHKHRRTPSSPAFSPMIFSQQQQEQRQQPLEQTRQNNQIISYKKPQYYTHLTTQQPNRIQLELEIQAVMSARCHLPEDWDQSIDDMTQYPYLDSIPPLKEEKKTSNSDEESSDDDADDYCDENIDGDDNQHEFSVTVSLFQKNYEKEMKKNKDKTDKNQYKTISNFEHDKLFNDKYHYRNPSTSPVIKGIVLHSGLQSVLSCVDSSLNMHSLSVGIDHVSDSAMIKLTQGLEDTTDDADVDDNTDDDNNNNNTHNDTIGSKTKQNSKKKDAKFAKIVKKLSQKIPQAPEMEHNVQTIGRHNSHPMDILLNAILVQYITAPILLLHGCQDKTVPMTSAHSVYNNALFAVPPAFSHRADHNDVESHLGPIYFDTLRLFIYNIETDFFPQRSIFNPCRYDIPISKQPLYRQYWHWFQPHQANLRRIYQEKIARYKIQLRQFSRATMPRSDRNQTRQQILMEKIDDAFSTMGSLNQQKKKKNHQNNAQTLTAPTLPQRPLWYYCCGMSNHESNAIRETLIELRQIEQIQSERQQQKKTRT